MVLLAQEPRVIFLGQNVAYDGNVVFKDLKNITIHRRLEMPVAEEMQTGMCIGLSLAGHIPICVFPRFNFMLLAADMIVNHLDRLPIYSNGGYRPRVIIRVAVPSISPLDPQAQHDGDFTDAFQMMCRTVQFFRLHEAGQIVPAYEYALAHEGASVLVERVDLYET